MDNLTKPLHYATRLDGDPAKACIDVHKLADSLPHGSGIDGDWHVTVLRNGDVRVDGEYHAMNDGYYDGWRSFKFFIRKARKLEAHALGGPCEGKVQITRRPGDIYLGTFTGGGGDGDWLYETVRYALSEAGLLTHRHEIVDATDMDGGKDGSK